MLCIFTFPVSARAMARVWLLLLCIWLVNPVRSQTVPCDAARLEAHAGSSSCIGCYVGNPAYAVDDNMISASSLILLPLGAGAYVQQTLYFNNASGQEDSVYLYLSFLSAVKDMNMLKGIQLATYNGGTYNNDRAALAVPAFRIRFLTAEQAIISWAPAKTFNKVEVRLVTGQSTPLLKVDIHYANRGTPVPIVASDTVNACSGTSVQLQATGAPGATLQWYVQPSGGCPANTGAQLTTPELTETVIYYISAAKGACVTPQRTPLVVNVQPGVVRQWDKNYGGSLDDMIKVIVPGSEGRYFLAGTTSSKDGDVTSPIGGTRAWVVKVGGKGGILWNRTYTNMPSNGYYYASTLTSMVPAGNGEFLLGGDVSNENTIYPKYPWIAKIDSNGNKLWDKKFVINYTQDIHYLTGIVPSNDGGYLLGGYNQDYHNYEYGEGWVIKIDANGNELWHKTLGGSGRDYLKCLISAGDGGYFLGGSTKSVDGDITDGNNGGSDYWVMKIDANGNKLWDKTFGGSGSDQIERMQLTGDGGLLLCGNIESKDGDVTNGASGNVWLVKVAANGNKLWDKTIEGGTVRTMAPFGNGNFLIGTRSFAAIKIDAQGNVLWEQSLGVDSQDEIYSILPTPDGGFFAGGLTRSSGTEPINGGSDAWLIKVMDNNCSAYSGTTARMDSVQTFMAAASPVASKDAAKQTVLTAYPNPFTRQLQLRYTLQKSARVSLQLYDMQGKPVANLKDAMLQAGVYNEMVNGSGFASGTYICRLLLDGTVYSQTVIKL